MSPILYGITVAAAVGGVLGWIDLWIWLAFEHKWPETACFLAAVLLPLSLFAGFVQKVYLAELTR